MIEKVNIDFACLPDFMSSETIDYHYGKHYQGYLDKVNKYYEEYSSNLLNIINPDNDIYQEAKFNACQAYNHQLFFEQLTYIKNMPPCEELMDWFAKEFGSFEEFKVRFEKEANELKGSGYVTLSICKTCIGKHASISSFKNETNSYISYTPYYDSSPLLLTLDLWEHSYYIDFRNNKSEYIKNFWKYVNWDVVYKRLKDNI